MTSIGSGPAFFGRSRERSILAAEVGQGTRLLTITGPSGMGKTCLAWRVLEDAAPAFAESGGAWLCGLAECQTPSELEAAVARMLGLPTNLGKDLAPAIANRGPILLVLDNLDALAGAASEVLAGWLDRCVELQILVTSIVPIGMDEEFRFELGPLEHDAAVALFSERARRAWVDRTIPEGEQQVVAELVGRLDRIPLAIELAAARIRVLPPSTLISRLDERFELLQSKKPGRHGSLLRALSLTWEFLSDRERDALSRASVFQGGFTFQAAEAVFLEEADSFQTLELLDDLRSKSLIQVDGSEPPRFHLLESVRDFGARELERSGRVDETIRRHARYFTEEGELHAAQVDGRGADSALRWLAAERANLVAAHQHSQETDPSVAARAGLALAPLLELDGPPASETAILESTLRAARASGSALLVIHALRSLGMAMKRHGGLEEALASLEEGQEIARREGLRGEQGRLLAEIGIVRTRTGQLEQASADLELAVELGRETGDPIVEGVACLHLGSAETARGDPARAERAFLRSRAIFSRAGDERGAARALQGIAQTWLKQGRPGAALRAAQEAREVFRRVESRAVSEARAAWSLGSIHLRAGNLDEAELEIATAVQLYRKLGNRPAMASALGEMGVIALERGDATQAEQRLREACHILEECGERYLVSLDRPFLAVAEARLGREEEAGRTLAEAKAFFSEAGDRGRLVMVDVIESVLELTRARPLTSTTFEGVERRARERLASISTSAAPTMGEHVLARRLLEQELARPRKAEEGLSPAVAEPVLIGPLAAWFQVPGRPRISLGRRHILRRMLDSLAIQRLETPGVGLSPDELFDVGWEGETIDPDSAIRRVYSSIWILRELGLTGILLSQADGYLLHPDAPLVRSCDPIKPG